MTAPLVVMRDAVDFRALATWHGPVAGYIDGPRSQWPADAWSRVPGSPAYRISVLGDPLGEIFDVEEGNVGAGPVAAAIRKRGAAGLRSVVYTSLSWWSQVRSDLAYAPPDAWWIADWNGQATAIPGAAAHQYQSHPTYDVSVISPELWPWPLPVEPVGSGSVAIAGAAYRLSVLPA